MAVKEKVSMLERRDFTKKGSYFMSYFVVLLRGSKGIMMDAEGLRHHIGKCSEGPLTHVIIHLMDIFKGETGRRNQLQAVVN